MIGRVVNLKRFQVFSADSSLATERAEGLAEINGTRLYFVFDQDCFTLVCVDGPPNCAICAQIDLVTCAPFPGCHVPGGGGSRPALPSPSASIDLRPGPAIGSGLRHRARRGCIASGATRWLAAPAWNIIKQWPIGLCGQWIVG